MTKILEVIINVYIVTRTRMADQILLVSYGSCHVIPHAFSCCQTADYLQWEEFAYNLRYVEKHGRDLVNPWSVRHMAVYHQFDAEKKSSKWIFLHPSAAVRQQLEKVVSEVACPGPADRRFLHLMFLWSTEKNWRDYVNYFENEFKALVCTFPWPALLRAAHAVFTNDLTLCSKRKKRPYFLGLASKWLLTMTLRLPMYKNSNTSARR